MGGHGQDRALCEAMRVTGKVGKGGLGDLLSQLRGAHLAQRGGIDEIQVAADEFREGVLGVLPGVAIKQIQVRFIHLYKYIAADSRNPTNILHPQQ